MNFLYARGPTLARHKQQKLLQNEEFCLQVDAHTLFVKDFDDKLVQMYARTQNENAVLTTYVQDIADMGHRIGNHEIPHLCKTVVGEGGLPRNEQAIEADNFETPKLTPLWGAGLSFSKCHAERRVPYDPHLLHVFDGEEFSRAVRLWTHGYDMYTPDRGVVFHDYRHKLMGGKKQVPWSFQPPAEDAERREREHNAALKRLRTLLRMEGGGSEPLGQYGLGTARSFDQYVSFSGVEPRTRKMSNGDQCGDLKWVPYSDVAAAHATRQVPASAPASASAILAMAQQASMKKHADALRRALPLPFRQQNMARWPLQQPGLLRGARVKDLHLPKILTLPPVPRSFVQQQRRARAPLAAVKVDMVKQNPIGLLALIGVTFAVCCSGVLRHRCRTDGRRKRRRRFRRRIPTSPER